MRESPRTKAELIAEISELKQKIKKLEKSEAKRKQAESQMEAALEAMKNSEGKYRGLTENINLGIYRNTVGPEGKFIEANPAIVAMFGFKSKGEFLAINVSDLYQDSKDREKFNKKMLKEGVVKSEELWLKKKDGSIFVGSVSAVAIKDERGRVKYYDGIIDNIDNRKRAESQVKAALAALRESEERFRTLYENSTLGIYRSTLDGRVLLANPALVRMLGYSSFAELTTRDLEKNGFEPAYPRSRFIEMIEKEGEVKGLESAWTRKDGVIIFIRENAAAIKDAQGKTLYYDGTVEDISERKQAEADLVKSKALLSDTEKMGKIGGWTFDVETMTQTWTEETFRILEIDLTNGEPKVPEGLEFIAPAFRPLAEKAIQRAVEFGEPYDQEWEIITQKGNKRWVHAVATTHQEQGKTKSVSGSFQDITGRKLAESQREVALAALRESEARQQLILATLPIASYTSPLDPAIDASWVSGNVEKVTGFTVEQYLATKDFWRNRLHADDRERVLAAYRNQAAGDEIVLEYRWLCKDGNYKWFHDRTIKKHTQQGMQYFGIILDISERKQAEAEKRILEERLQWAEKMEAIGTLAGGIAHDFNNLLMGIQGYASMTLTNLDPANPNFERLKRIEEQVQSGADLTRQLLGFARGGRYEVKPTDMNDIIEKTSFMFGRTKKEISIYRKTGKDIWRVEVDRGQMEQVFVNLYVNAWQAMSGGGEIYLETENVLLNDEKALPYSVKPGKYVKITVTDNGSGMDEKTRLRVFDPFFTTKEMGRGIGLGLASVYGIIKGHQGMINVYSEPGHGTTFTIYLPASEKDVVKDEPPSKKIVRGTETVLLVEDEKTVLTVSKEMLEALGYTVHTAGNGQEAIAAYQGKRNTIDLVILDMVMPGISGSETFDRLRTINPEVRVLLSSGYSLNGEAQHIMERGCNGFLQKPFQIEKLSQKIRETLGT